MTIKNFLFSTVPNILYELGASVKVGSLAKWVNLIATQLCIVSTCLFDHQRAGVSVCAGCDRPGSLQAGSDPAPGGGRPEGRAPGHGL